MKVQTPEKTHNSYVDGCFAFDYDEERETREWRSMEETKNIPSLGLGPNPKQGVAAIDEALKTYPDFSFLYGWKGYIYQNRLNDLSTAKEVFEQGLSVCHSKVSLLDSLGQAYYEEGKLHKAVPFWIQSCALQMGTGTFEYAHPFMMLAYAAQSQGLKAEAEALFRQTDRVDNIRLNHQGLAEMNKRVNQLSTMPQYEGVKKAIQTLCDFYKVGV